MIGDDVMILDVLPPPTFHNTIFHGRLRPSNVLGFTEDELCIEDYWDSSNFHYNLGVAVCCSNTAVYVFMYYYTALLFAFDGHDRIERIAMIVEKY